MGFNPFRPQRKDSVDVAMVVLAVAAAVSGVLWAIFSRWTSPRSNRTPPGRPTSARAATGRSPPAPSTSWWFRRKSLTCGATGITAAGTRSCAADGADRDQNHRGS